MPANFTTKVGPDSILEEEKLTNIMARIEQESRP
jgi:hypothetical protein